MFYIHQQFLIVIQITLSRIAKKNSSSWESNLQKTVDQKILKKMKSKSEATQMLRVYCANCENIIRNICKTNQNKKIFKNIGVWIADLNKFPAEKIRDTLYNIEQFKGDSSKLPEIKSQVSNSRKLGMNESKAGSSSKDAGGPVIGAGAKSAGSINEDKTSKGAT